MPTISMPPVVVRSMEVAGLPLVLVDEAHGDTMHGGNKLRKLVGILEDARARGVTDLVTFGAVGSHHVVATAMWGREEGMRVHAVLIPQPETPHVRANAARIASWCASWTLAIRPAELPVHTAKVVARLEREGRVWMQVPPGGSSVAGTAGWSRMAASLELDVDEVIVASGSGGTAAGLLAGRVAVRAVRVGPRLLTNRARIRHLAGRAARAVGVDVRASLIIDHGWLAGGYGVVDAPTEEAWRAGRAAGLPVETTYTAKALACALERARSGLRVAFVQTASGSPLPVEGCVPDAIGGLWLGVDVERASRREARRS